MEKRELSEKQRFWFDHLQECIASGLSMKEYAAEHGLKLQVFYYWKKYLKKLGVISDKGQRPKFVKAVLRKESLPSPLLTTRTSITFSNGVSIEIARDVDVVAMAELLRVARGL